MEQSNEQQQIQERPSLPAGEVPSELSPDEIDIMLGRGLNEFMNDVDEVQQKNPLSRRLVDKVRRVGGAFAKGASALTAVYANPLVARVSQAPRAVARGMAGMMGARRAAPVEVIDPDIEATRAAYMSQGLSAAKAAVVANKDLTAHNKVIRDYINTIQSEADPDAREGLKVVFGMPIKEAIRNKNMAAQRVNENVSKAALKKWLADRASSTGPGGYVDPLLENQILSFV
jgi:hypothetical protein